VRGKVSGKVVKSNQPINFLGSVDKKTGEVTDQKHDLFGKKIAGSILVFPNGIGSSVGAFAILDIKFEIRLNMCVNSRDQKQSINIYH